MESTTDYMHGMIAYSIDELSREEISKKLNESNKTHNSLIFYMYQSEYNLLSIDEVENYMQKNTEYFNRLRKIVIDYVEKDLKRNELRVKIGDIEDKIGQNNYEFSEKLGKMVREDKKLMINQIINRVFLRRLFSST